MGFRTLRKPEAIDVPSAQHEGDYSGFQGDLNPVYTLVSSYKVFLLYYHCIKPAIATKWLATVTTKDAPQQK